MRPGFFARLLVNAAALWVAARIVPGVTYQGGWLPFFCLALVFGIVNTVVGLVTKILTIPLILLTLGLFLLVINGLMLQLTSGIAGTLGIGFHVAGFWPAFWGALVVSIVSALLNLVIVDRRPTMVISRDRTWWS
jgi:putative membrane protein